MRLLLLCIGAILLLGRCEKIPERSAIELELVEIHPVLEDMQWLLINS